MSSKLAGWVPGPSSGPRRRSLRRRISAISRCTSQPGGRGRAEHGQPLAVQRVPRAVAADPLQRAVDEPHQTRCSAELIPMPYGSSLRLGPDDMEVRILRHQPGQDRVVGADRVDLPLLQGHQTVRPRDHPDDDRRRRDLLDALQRCGALRDAHPLSGQIRRLRDRRIPRRQDPLVGVEVHGREVDQFLALTGDGHRLDDDVDLIVLQCRDPVGRREDAVLDL